MNNSTMLYARKQKEERLYLNKNTSRTYLHDLKNGAWKNNTGNISREKIKLTNAEKKCRIQYFTYFITPSRKIKKQEAIKLWYSK